MSIKGFDVYHGDVIPSFHTLASDGYVFGFAKATQGLATDPAFADYYPRMKAANIIRGPYCFWDPETDWEQQTDHLIATAPHEPGDMRYVLDIERDHAVLVDQVRQAALRIKQQTGMYPILYMNVDFWDRYFNGTDVVSWCPLWIAEYGVSAPRVACEFWQYDENGMDKDVFFGTVDDLKERHTYK